MAVKESNLEECIPCLPCFPFVYFPTCPWLSIGQVCSLSKLRCYVRSLAAVGFHCWSQEHTSQMVEVLCLGEL